MKLRLKGDNWDYGTIGEVVNIEGHLFNVGDIYTVSHYTFDHKFSESDCMIVNKQDEYSNKKISFFMGMGIYGLNFDLGERVIGKVKDWQQLKEGDEHQHLLVSQ